MSRVTPTSKSSSRRLDALQFELGIEDALDIDAAEVDSSLDAEEVEGPRARDPFFTARVLGALPNSFNPQQWLGASPSMRAGTVLAFHLAAGIVGVLVYRWAAPRVVDDVASAAADAASPWAASVALPADVLTTAGGAPAMAAIVAVVGLVAFWAARSHTRAT